MGAGAVGGYFGGRLLEKGEDVSYFVREGRQKQLQELGLDIESIHGNVLLQPKTILAGEEAGPFDVILLATKSYHLDGAIKDIRPYITKETVILPLLNGISHFETLDKEFGAEKVIGGLCSVESTLDSKGRIIQTSPIHDFFFGERSGEKTERILKIADAFSGTKANFRLSDNINQDLWHKYMFISTMSGITTLMRQPIGPIRETESGHHTIKRLQSEIFGIMKSVNAPIAEEIESIQMKQIAELGYTMKSSMQRDMEKLAQVEVEHLHGYLLEIAKREKMDVPVLEAVYANLKIYQEQL